VRVRPIDESDKRSQREVWKVDSARNQILCIDDKMKKNDLQYTFDYVFGPEVRSNQIIFDAIGGRIVQNVMEGYNGTIFAYGQTNSGKTYTMMGTDDNPGIIPIAIEEVFNYIKNSPEREFLLRVSYLEIYNEVINDLLRPEGSNLVIREDKKRPFIEGLKEEIVVSPEHVVYVINSGEAHRHVASTDYNITSSRSHTIFRMIIESNPINDQGTNNLKMSVLTLVDLAGSEKVVSDSLLRRREGAYINKSLLTLGNIVSQLSGRKKGEKIGYLPYRDSKLTRILESSLSGNAKIAIINTCSPTSGNFEETNSTLKFASRAKKLVNAAKFNITDEKLMITQYKNEIDDLKKKLELAEEVEQKLSNQQLQFEHSSEYTLQKDQELQKLRQELNEQESARVALEEKIKQLTKLILVSSSVTTPNISQQARDRNSVASLVALERRTRSISLRYSGDQQIPAAKNVKGAPSENPPTENRVSSSPSPTGPSPYGNNDMRSLMQTLDNLQHMNTALSIKIEVLEQQLQWKDNQISKLKAELEEAESKRLQHLEAQIEASKIEELARIVQMIRDGYKKKIEEMQDLLQGKDMQIDMLKMDMKLLSEKLSNPKI